MSNKYRIEREPMVRGQLTPLFRVVVRLGKHWYGTVQAGLDRAAADAVCANLNLTEADKEARNRSAIAFKKGGYRR